MFDTFILQQRNQLPKREVGDLSPHKRFMPSMFSVSKASVSKRLQRSVASFQCQSRCCRATLRYNIANSLTARHQLLEPLTLRARFLLSMRSCLKDCLRNCGLCIFHRLWKVSNMRLSYRSLPQRSHLSLAVICIGSVEVSSVMIQSQ